MPQESSIRALLRMQSPSNVRANPSRYNSRLADEDYALADELLPDADSFDLENAQTDAFEESGGTYAPSRESLRESALNPLRQRLGIGRRQHEQALERDVTRAQIAAANADRQNRYILDRQERTQRGSDERQQRQFDQSLSLQERLFGQQNRAREDQQEAALEARTTPRATQRAVPAGVYSALTKAEQNQPGNPLTRWLYGASASREMDSALRNYLDAKGTLSEVDEVASVLAEVPGATVDEKIANSGIPQLAQLDSRERQYLQRRLGGR